MKTGLIIWLIAFSLHVFATDYPIDLKKAASYMNEAKELAILDNGKLWGVYLYGPILIVDPETRFVVANEGDMDGKLSPEGELYIGYLSPNDMIANTSVQWGGKRWMMVMFSSLSDDKPDRTNLMMHELWHCIQDSIGLPMGSPDNSHLDQMDARILLKLEWKALEQGVNSAGDERVAHLSGALGFRALRQRLYPGSRQTECRLEMHEGLAEYTGMVLSHLSHNQKIAYFERLDFRKNVPSYVRSFAYISGPLYGFLLDESGADWRNGLTPTSDFGQLLTNAYQAEVPVIDMEHLSTAAELYSYDQICAIEQQRDALKQEKLRRLRARFIDGKTLEIALITMKMEFDPGNLMAFEDIGTIYPTLKITDQWGMLIVEREALLGKNWDFVRLNADAIETEGNTIKGDGWILELQDGWYLKNDKGKMTIKNKYPG